MQCEACEKNTYGDTVGATQCKPCKGSTISDYGATTCKCKGLNRKYLADIGSCICKTGYKPIDGSSSYSDGYADCERIVYEACPAGQVRDSNAVCKQEDDCSQACDGKPGRISLDFGVCQCEDVTKVD